MEELKLYKMYVAEPLKEGSLTSSTKYGFMTSKPVSGEDLLAISQYYMHNKLDSSSLKKTLFSKDELVNVSLMNKVYKQLLHYISGGNYGTQKFEFEGKKFTFDIVQIVSKEELFEAIKKDIYSSKPLSEEKVKGILKIIKKHSFEINYLKVKNNEFKVLLLKSVKSQKIYGVTGDDVVRTIIHIATESTLLIKSKSVIEALHNSRNNIDIHGIMATYLIELSQVFNRHKKLILALKSSFNASIINKISKMSKTNHIPIKPALNKIFMSKYLKISEDNITDSLKKDLPKLTAVDKMRLLNHTEVLLTNAKNSVFLIRNGKVFIKEEERPINEARVNFIKKILTKSLVKDLKHLNGVIVKYPEYIDYALPISEKKSVSNLPFGTTITSSKLNKYLVAGMYWENNWGAYDLDLSSISIDGSRVGWGQLNSYSKDILFSGDITNAPDGAIEYLANRDRDPVVLINNIYNGDNDSKFKIVVGETNRIRKEYLGTTLIEIDCQFKGECRNMTLGALYKDKFIVYPLFLGSKSVSSKKDKAILPYMLVEHTKLKALLEMAGANIIYEGNEFDIDLSIENVTFDKLTNIFSEEKQLREVL